MSMSGTDTDQYGLVVDKKSFTSFRTRHRVVRGELAVTTVNSVFDYAITFFLFPTMNFYPWSVFSPSVCLYVGGRLII
jgi:hypothetical protein